MLLPIYRYQRFPANPAISYENRLLFNVTLTTSRAPWRYSLRTLVEGRFPDDRAAFARLRFRPGLEHPLPLRTTWRPVIGCEQRILPRPLVQPIRQRWHQLHPKPLPGGVRMPVTELVSVRPYYLLLSVNLPAGWDTNQVIGISMAFKVPRKTK
jgi:hypothetical protein